jgi:TPR repeat protein
MVADESDVSAWFNYAITFENGYGGQINLPEAMKYYKFAADFNRLRSIVGYGYTLSSGYSVSQIQNCSEIFQKKQQISKIPKEYFNMAQDWKFGF